MLKTELYSLIKLSKPRFKTYKIDSMPPQYDHSVLRLSPYHPDLNPIELMWALVKDFTAARNVYFNVNDVMKIAEEIQLCKERDMGNPINEREEN
jgi:hypothetical protein